MIQLCLIHLFAQNRQLRRPAASLNFLLSKKSVDDGNTRNFSFIWNEDWWGLEWKYLIISRSVFECRNEQILSIQSAVIKCWLQSQMVKYWSCDDQTLFIPIRISNTQKHSCIMIINTLHVIYGLKIDPHNDQLPVGLIAQLVEHCTSIAEVGVRIPVQAFLIVA